MTLTSELRTKIQNMSYEQMLQIVRFAKIGEPLMCGESGDYFLKTMNERKSTMPKSESVAISKRVGWNPPS